MYEYQRFMRIPNPFKGAWPFGTRANPDNLFEVHVSRGHKGRFSKYLADLLPGLRRARIVRWTGMIDPHIIVMVKLGNGAGYINGRTAFVALNARDPNAPLHSGVRKLITFGWPTQNANKIPYSDSL